MARSNFRHRAIVYELVDDVQGADGIIKVPKRIRHLTCDFRVKAASSHPMFQQVESAEIAYEVFFRVNPKLEMDDHFLVWQRQRYDLATPVIDRDATGHDFMCSVGYPVDFI